MAKLREITGQYAELQKIADSADADDASMVEAIQNSLGDIADSFNEKAEAIVHVVNNMQPDIDAIDKEIKRLNDRKKAIKNRQDSLKDYLRMNMERTGIKKISCPLFTISCVAGREIAVINNEGEIPDQYMTVKTEISPDKLALARALKEGIDVPGASLDRAKSSIRIK